MLESSHAKLALRFDMHKSGFVMLERSEGYLSYESRLFTTAKADTL